MQVVGLKKLAPYREDGGVSRPNYQQLGQLRGKLLAGKKRKGQPLSQVSACRASQQQSADDRNQRSPSIVMLSCRRKHTEQSLG